MAGAADGGGNDVNVGCLSFLVAKIMLRFLCAVQAAHAFVLHAPKPRDPVVLRASATADVDALKRALLDAIGKSAPTAEILAAAAALEATDTRTGDIEGRWSLVYSTRARAPADAAETPLAALSNAVYGVLFTAAPFLAGGGAPAGDGRRPRFAVANEQRIEGGVLENEVAIGDFLRLRVFGSCEAAGPDALGVTFEGVEVNGVATIPLPRPRGVVKTTFVDGRVRLARGSRGGLFVLRRRRARGS